MQPLLFFRQNDNRTVFTSIWRNKTKFLPFQEKIRQIDKIFGEPQCGKMKHLLPPKKKIRQINYLAFSFKKRYFHEIFVKEVTVNFRNFHTVEHSVVIW